ncbi:TetR family transcriptional regulator [Geothermobacter ehrlichii]|uniref:TetR family transcriptional regulator n=1 Tax=Geothermobacter ehrlichii TaxID=213224 RepID=A0A5D3WJJ3_9BACT|nr:TetR/AcrR family transcriptional regulator [Geothermobacter ehrlichii]TYO99093.1 TetR family transcriptional regulator [Geothermobacter ehrlichii]
MSQPDTKTRILDAAEELFARSGFHATSLRMITGHAGVNLAAVNYHFGSKEELLEAVIERRLAPLNRQRLALLDSELALARRAGRRPDPRELMRALIEPTIRLRDQGAGPERFITLVGRILADPEGVGRDIFLCQMGPFISRLFEALHQALPQVSRTLLFWRLHFAIGSLSHVMRCHDRHIQLPAGVEARLDTARLAEVLLAYTLAGMEVPE